VPLVCWNIGTLRICARILANVVGKGNEDGVLAFGGDLEKQSGGGPDGCTIELTVGRLYQASERMKPHPVRLTKTVDNGENSRRGHLINSAKTV
jgi:hypothetical protein